MVRSFKYWTILRILQFLITIISGNVPDVTDDIDLHHNALKKIREIVFVEIVPIIVSTNNNYLVVHHQNSLERVIQSQCLDYLNGSN